MLKTVAKYDESSVDITGGTINGTSIGATTPADGTFTTLNANGNVTLGDASTDTVTVNGYMGVGGAANSAIAILASNTALGSTTQHGVYSLITGTSAATSLISGFTSLPATAAASFTVADVYGYRASNASKGAGSTITNLHGLYIADQTQGTNNYGITSLVSSGANKWNIYASGSAANYFAGDVQIADKLVHFGDDNTAIRFPAADTVTVETGGLERVRVDSSGRVGVGVTPSAWSTLKALQLPAGAIAGFAGGTNNNQLNIVNNAYFGGVNYTYITTNAAQRYMTIAGRHEFSTAPSGNAGDPVTFTERFRIGLTESVFNEPGENYDFRVESDTNTHAFFVDAGNSRVGINNSTPSEALEVSGNIKTTAPTGGTAAAWKLGTVATVSPILPNRTIEVEINGTTYYLHAKTTND